MNETKRIVTEWIMRLASSISPKEEKALRSKIRGLVSESEFRAAMRFANIDSTKLLP